MHYYQHHIGDFIKDTANLDDHQLATYMRLLWRYYTDEKPISDELEDVAFAMRSDEKTVRLLLRHYFRETTEGWRHNRCDREIADFHAKADKARESAKARWKNKNPMQTQSERNANVSENDASIVKIDANQEPITNISITNVIDKRKSAISSKPEDVEQKIWDDFLALRKAKRSPLTQTALDGIGREARKAGLHLNQALAMCCERGWQGFKSDWVHKSQGETPYQRSMRERTHEFAPNVAQRKTVTIESGERHAATAAILG